MATKTLYTVIVADDEDELREAVCSMIPWQEYGFNLLGSASNGLDALQLVEQYAVSVSRWIQCEECISEYGFLAKHPTTGNAIASPYVSMSQQYMKQVNQIWYQIYQVVKENCSVEWQGSTPQDDVMERLLRARNGGM